MRPRSIKSLLKPFYQHHTHEKKYQALHVLHATENGAVAELLPGTRFGLVLGPLGECGNQYTAVFIPRLTRFFLAFIVVPDSGKFHMVQILCFSQARW